jgi:PIN domain nuclease of toxin-antitoxin system
VAKFRSGKQPEFAAIAANVAAVVSLHGFVEVPIAMRHAHAAANLPFYHKDPMDRLLIGQAIVEDMTIVTADGAFASYAARLLW